MKKFLLFVVMSAAIAVSAQNQLKTLNVQDITPALSVYPCGDRPEALVVIRCSEPFDLEFSSNVDNELDLTKMTDGSEKVYNIVFQTRAQGTSYKGRQLVISANGFSKFYLPLDLKDKEKLEYLVSDPYSKLRSLFYTTTEAGQSLFSAGDYLPAKDQFIIAKQCPEYETVDNSIDYYIAQCDSMVQWTEIVKQAEYDGDYSKAIDLLRKMSYANPRCDIITTRYNSDVAEFNRKSSYDMTVGQRYMDDGKYEQARELFEHAIAINSPSASTAALNLETISQMNYKVDNKTRSLFYQKTGDCSIGLTTGSFNPDKIGGYFSFGFNKGCLDAFSDKLEALAIPESTQLEAVVNAGFTIRLYYPKNDYIPHVWLMATPFGYACGGYNMLEDGDETSIKLYHALAPEVGVAVRIWRIALNYKLQYRYVFGDDDLGSDILGGTKSSFGIGFCW